MRTTLPSFWFSAVVLDPSATALHSRATRDDLSIQNNERLQRTFVSKQIVPPPRTTAQSRASSLPRARAIAHFGSRIRQGIVLARGVEHMR